MAATIARDEVEYFAAPQPGERVLGDGEREMLVEVVAPTFRPGQKWRFSQGDSTFYAAVLDREFLGKVARHEVTFGTGDVLRVQMRERFSQTPAGMTALREVVRVLERIPAPQINLLF